LKKTNAIELLQKTRSVLLRIEDGFLVALLVAILAMAVVQIFLRNVFDSGIIWGDILVRILVLWIGMAGAVIGSRTGEHINVDIVTRHLSEAARPVVRSVIAILTAAVCSVASYYSFKFVAAEAAFGGTAFADVPVWICQVIIPVGFAVIALRYLLLGIQNILPSRPTSA
jgi:TRAP-type C4-dicarboxylate transport system permease small subunit